MIHMQQPGLSLDVIRVLHDSRGRYNLEKTQPLRPAVSCITCRGINTSVGGKFSGEKASLTSMRHMRLRCDAYMAMFYSIHIFIQLTEC